MNILKNMMFNKGKIKMQQIEPIMSFVKKSSYYVCKNMDDKYKWRATFYDRDGNEVHRVEHKYSDLLKFTGNIDGLYTEIYDEMLDPETKGNAKIKKIIICPSSFFGRNITIEFYDKSNNVVESTSGYTGTHDKKGIIDFYKNSRPKIDFSYLEKNEVTIIDMTQPSKCVIL